MSEVTINIAGYYVKVLTLHESIEPYSSKYIIESSVRESIADLEVAIRQTDINYERDNAAREYALEGKEPQRYSDAYLESLAVYRKICEAMVEYDTVLMHGSVVAVDGYAYLFTAKSGTGKSTHTRYWREVFGERAVMVNDGKTLLKLNYSLHPLMYLRTRDLRNPRHKIRHHCKTIMSRHWGDVVLQKSFGEGLQII